jgi:hypothetical protein
MAFYRGRRSSTPARAYEDRAAFCKNSERSCNADAAREVRQLNAESERTAVLLPPLKITFKMKIPMAGPPIIQTGISALTIKSPMGLAQALKKMMI